MASVEVPSDLKRDEVMEVRGCSPPENLFDPPFKYKGDALLDIKIRPLYTCDNEYFVITLYT